MKTIKQVHREQLEKEAEESKKEVKFVGDQGYVNSHCTVLVSRIAISYNTSILFIVLLFDVILDSVLCFLAFISLIIKRLNTPQNHSYHLLLVFSF